MKRAVLTTCAVMAIAISTAFALSYERFGSASVSGKAKMLDEEPAKVSAAAVKAEALSRMESAGVDAGIARKAVSITIDLPFEMTPTEEEVNLFTILDEDGDGKKWAYRANFKGLVSPSNSKADCDDWAITPGIRFENIDKNYELSFTLVHNMAGAGFQSSFEVYIGTSPTVDGMTTKIGEILGFYCEKRDVDVAQSIPFAVPGEAGTYYIGFRCITPMDANGISSWPATMKKIAVKELDTAALAPSQPSDAVATPAQEGGLSATVTFTMPLKAMNGSDLDADTDLTAILTSPVESKTVSGKPGSAKEVKLETLQGNNDLSLQVNGMADGEPLVLSVYTGVVLPMRIHNLAGVLSRDNMSFMLSWTPPTEGENGGYIDVSSIEYDIYLYDNATQDYNFLESSGTDCAYTYTMSEGEQLRTVRLQVRPRNAAGTSTDLINWVDEDPVYVSDMLGTPYALPAIETFDNLDMKYTPLTISRPNDEYAGRWSIIDPSEIMEDENQSALVAYSPYNEGSTMGRVLLPKFSTEGVSNAAFEMTYLRYSGYASQMTVYARNYDEDLTELGTVNCDMTTGWASVSYPLPEQFQDKPWVQIVVDVALDDVDYMYGIDKYAVQTSAENDLALTSVSVSDDLYVGKEVKFTAEVSNVGFKPLSSDVRFEAVCGEEVIASGTVAGSMLQTGEKESVEWPFSPKMEQVGKEVTVKATLVSADEVGSNDSRMVTVYVREPELPAVKDLSAENANGGVQLTWSEPALNKTMAESFESLEPFTYGENLAGFINHDGDGQNVYRFSNNSMPNEGLPKAFMVIDMDQLEYSEGLEARTGHQYLMATCPERVSTSAPLPDPADDWLITPELRGGSYVSFYLGIISEAYPETIRLMVSNTDSDPSDFTELSTQTKSTVGWDKVECKLPEDARYFAINYVSRDMFGILVDDVRYLSASDFYSVEKYNIYRDGVLVGTSDVPGYFDDTVENGVTYEYYVTTVTDAESAPSNLAYAEVEQSGIVANQSDFRKIEATRGTIVLSGFDDTAVVICDVSGRVVYSGNVHGRVSVPVGRGVYVISYDGFNCKTVVK